MAPLTRSKAQSQAFLTNSGAFHCLPSELVSRILHFVGMCTHLETPDPTAELSRVLLLCKRLHTPALRLLYTYIRLETVQQAAAFLSRLNQRPDLGLLVRRLECTPMTLTCPACGADHLERPVPLRTASLASVIESCPSIQWLEIANAGQDSDRLQVAMQRLTGLKTLSIRGRVFEAMFDYPTYMTPSFFLAGHWASLRDLRLHVVAAQPFAALRGVKRFDLAVHCSDLFSAVPPNEFLPSGLTHLSLRICSGAPAVGVMRTLLTPYAPTLRALRIEMSTVHGSSDRLLDPLLPIMTALQALSVKGDLISVAPLAARTAPLTALYFSKCRALQNRLFCVCMAAKSDLFRFSSPDLQQPSCGCQPDILHWDGQLDGLSDEDTC